MNPLDILVPLEGDFFTKTNDIANQAQTAIKTVIVAAVYIGLLWGLVKAKFAFGAIVLSGIVAAFVTWLVLLDGITVIANWWNGTLA